MWSVATDARWASFLTSEICEVVREGGVAVDAQLREIHLNGTCRYAMTRTQWAGFVSDGTSATLNARRENPCFLYGPSRKNRVPPAAQEGRHWYIMYPTTRQWQNLTRYPTCNNDIYKRCVLLEIVYARTTNTYGHHGVLYTHCGLDSAGVQRGCLYIHGITSRNVVRHHRDVACLLICACVV